MNRSQALKQAVGRWGKKAAVRDEGRKTSPEIRAASLKRLAELRAMPEPRSPEVRKEIKEHLGAGLDYRYSVGYVGGIAGFSFFSVQGQGDTWEEAFAKAEPTYVPRKKAA